MGTEQTKSRAALLNSALWYGEQGYAVIPMHTPNGNECSCGKPDCKSPGKHPRIITGAGHQNASSEAEQIRRWWTRWPDANIGIITGHRSGILVLDIDGDEGRQSIRGRELPPTPTVTTGRGYHYYYRWPGHHVASTAGLLPGVDARGDDYLVVAPPSVHYSGVIYEWAISPREMTLSDPPRWLIEALKPKPGHTQGGTPKLVEGQIPHGTQHRTLVSLAGSMRARGMDADAIDAALWLTNIQRCEVPGSREDIRGIAERVCRYPPGEIASPPHADKGNGDGQHPKLDDIATMPLTDAGNAEAFVLLFGDRLRYVHELDLWLVWDGVRWSPDIQEETRNLAISVARTRYEMAQSMPTGGASKEETSQKTRIKNAAMAWARKSENSSSISNMLKEARSNDPLPVRAETLDNHPDLLVCKNGVINLETSEMLAGQQSWLMTKSTNHEYHPERDCPRWMQFLDEIFEGDGDLALYIQRAVGYTLTGHTEEQKLFLCHGGGANGKSVFLGLLRHVLGEYAANVPFDTFVRNDVVDAGRANPNVMSMMGARLVTASEVDERRRLAVGTVKALTGSDPITARQLYGQNVQFMMRAAIWLAVNDKPEIPDSSVAMWRRMVLIPFNVNFVARRTMDKELENKLRATETEGILAWAIAGARMWYEEGLDAPEAILDATQEYQQDEDVLGLFLYEKIEQVTAQYSVGATRLYKAYEAWCRATGQEAVTQTKFGREVGKRFKKRKGVHAIEYIGLRFKDSDTGIGEDFNQQLV